MKQDHRKVISPKRKLYIAVVKRDASKPVSSEKEVIVTEEISVIPTFKVQHNNCSSDGY